MSEMAATGEPETGSDAYAGGPSVGDAGSKPGAPFHRFLISSITVLALSLRLWGITWSLPNEDRLFTYHPDEGVNLINGVLENGNPGPHLDLGFYNYGSVYFYLWQGAVAINCSYGFVRLPPTGAPTDPSPNSIASMILLGRLLSALLGALSVPLLITLGTRLFGRSAGLMAGATFAVMPLAVVHSHFATVDVTATFFVCLALAAGARLLESGRWADVLRAGICCGIAAATKYTCALVVLAPVIALLGSHRKSAGSCLVRVAFLTAAAAAGFCGACPGIILNWPKFSHDFLFELQKSGEGMGLLFVDTGPGWVYHVTNSLRYGLGLMPLAVTMLAVVYALVKGTRQDWYLLAFLLPYYLVVGAAQVKFARYMIPIFPVFAVLIGRLAVGPSPSRPALQKLSAGFVSLAVISGALMSLSFDRAMASPDARDRAHEWMRENLHDGAVIGFARLPWYDVPPLAPEFTAPFPALRREGAERLTRFKCRLPETNTELDRSIFRFNSLDGVVVSDLATEDWERLDYPTWKKFKPYLETRFRAEEFTTIVWTGGWSLAKPHYLPNDILYVCPRITVYLGFADRI